MRLQHSLHDGTTARDLLEELVSQNAELQNVVFEAPGKLTPHITLVLNGRFLELTGGLDTELHDGDYLRIMLAMSGG
jgi:molybdopterin converting factor small subunit